MPQDSGCEGVDWIQKPSHRKVWSSLDKIWKLKGRIMGRWELEGTPAFRRKLYLWG